MITVVIGEDGKLVSSAVKKSRKEEFPDTKAMNFETLDKNECSFIDIYNACTLLPLGYERKCVIVDNCAFLTKSKAKMAKGDDDEPFLEYCRNPDENVDLYLMAYEEGRKSDKKSNKYIKAIEEGGGKLQEVVSFSPQKWRTYIPAFFAKRGQKITSDGIEEFIARSCMDYSSFYSDACKLSVYAGDEVINGKMVKTLISPPMEERAYTLTNALLNRETDKAIEIYRSLRTMGQEAIPVINMLGREFIRYDRVRWMSKEGYGPNEIASELRIKPGQVYGIERTLKALPLNADFPKEVDKLYELTKSIMQGKVDRDIGLTLYLANFSL